MDVPSLPDTPAGLAGLKTYLGSLRALAPELSPEATTVFNALVDCVCEALDAAHTIGRTDGAAAAMARVRAILAAPAAALCPKLARHIALDTDLTAEHGLGVIDVSVAQAQARERGCLDA